MQKGIDISYWQNPVDFKKVKNEVDFIILREGYRQAIDQQFFNYVKKCKENKIRILAVYHFSYALNVNQAKQEALFCIKNVKEAGLPDDTIIFYDFEYDTVKKAKEDGVILTKEECIQHTKMFCETIKEESNYRPGIYCNVDYYKNWYDKETIDKYILWLADWNGDPDYECDIHQFTSKGVVSGIAGNVDMNHFYEKTNRYYSSDMLEVAKKWIGLNEFFGTHKEILDVYNNHRPLARSYHISLTDSWCDAFISACAIKSGCVPIIGTEVSCERHVDIFKEKQIWIEDGNIVPEVGDIVLYNWNDTAQPNDGRSTHIGLVESVKDNMFVSIEGNLAGKVGRRYTNVGYGCIRGFARPRYTDKKYNSPVNYGKIVSEILEGKWGNGEERRVKLISAGYNYHLVQDMVNYEYSIESIVNEVLIGKWGNGEERKRRLTEAGHDYDLIQTVINNRLQ